MNGRAGKDARRALRVLALPAFRRRTLNPFQALLYDEVAKLDVTVRDWSFPRALFERADLWHLHHPDTVVFPRSALQSGVETTLLRLLLAWARLRGTRVLWTVHDLDSSDNAHPRLERWFWRYFLPRLDGCVFLTEAGRQLGRQRFPELARVPSFVTAHGDFRPAYPDTLTREEARRSLGLDADVPVLLNFGLIRPYKNVPPLIDAVAALEAEEAVLLVAGRVWDAELERDIRERAAKATGVRLHLEWIPFEETQRYFRACDLVVLPYRRILNSGTVMLALAFERPVLVPDRGAMSELRERFGDVWIRLFEDELDTAALRDAIAWARDTERPPPDLEGIDWATLAAETRAIYDALLDPAAPVGATGSRATRPPSADRGCP